MPEDDWRIALAEIRGMLSATLPTHAARLDEHDRVLATLSSTQVQQGQQLAALTAVTTERATEQRTTKPWVAVVSLLVAVAGVLAGVLVAILT